MSLTIVSTFSPKNYKEYAKFFVESAKKYIDNNIKVVLYTDVPMEFSKSNFHNLILGECSPELCAFKDRNKDKLVKQGTKGFLTDAVRFSHKSYCIIHAARTCTTDKLVWLDADTEIIDYVNENYFTNFLPENNFVSFLGRPDRYTETGWLAFDMTNKWSKEYFDLWEWYYNTDEIYNLPAQLDCHVFDKVTQQFIIERKINGANITPTGIKKQHFNRTFIGKMTHYKGNDKEDRDSNYIAAKHRAKIHAKTNTNRT
jgi:hypothetical protein